MSKNRKFNNRAAKRFNQIEKVATMDQDEVFDIWSGDLKIITGQLTAARNHTGPYPTYVANGFSNLSSALFFYRLTNNGGRIAHGLKVKTKDLDEDDVESIRELISDAYRRNSGDMYQKWVQDFSDRRRLLSKAFIPLYPKVYKRTKDLKLEKKSQRRDLTIQIYGDPVYNFKVVHKILNSSTVSAKKKMRFLRKVYKKRFPEAIGAAMTVDNLSSDSLGIIFDHINRSKKSKRAKYLYYFAKAYKKNQSRYFQMNNEFIRKNKDLVKQLKKLDIGFKKAVRKMKQKTTSAKNDSKRREFQSNNAKKK